MRRYVASVECPKNTFLSAVMVKASTGTGEMLVQVRDSTAQICLESSAHGLNVHECRDHMWIWMTSRLDLTEGCISRLNEHCYVHWSVGQQPPPPWRQVPVADVSAGGRPAGAASYAHLGPVGDSNLPW